jgi:hypothetical protein
VYERRSAQNTDTILELAKHCQAAKPYNEENRHTRGKEGKLKQINLRAIRQGKNLDSIHP